MNSRVLRSTIVALIPVALSAWQATSFEVAEVKPSDPSVLKMGKGRQLPGGRIEVPGYTLRELIMFSYGATDDMISGGPKWVSEDRFDIVAKAPSDAKDDGLRVMMQTLLSDRFGLVMHREDKAMPAYALVVGKGTDALKPGSGAQSQCGWTVLEDGLRRRECHNITMDEFAKQLPHTGGIGIDRPVSDETGLKGAYDFQFEVGDSVESSGPTIFAALQKVGLKLESRKIAMPAIVIDSAAKPTGN